MIPRIDSNICQLLLDKEMKFCSSYTIKHLRLKVFVAYALRNETTLFSMSSYIFVEHSSDIYKRLQEIKRQDSDIVEFVNWINSLLIMGKTGESNG